MSPTGGEAVESCKTNQYDLVLMDIQMPKMDGMSATRAIRMHEKIHDKAPVPVIGVTAYALQGDREKCLKAGMDDYIAKPFDPELLKQKMRKLLRFGMQKQFA